MTTKISFRLFVVLWNQLQKQTTPNIHIRIARWLEKAWLKGDRYLLLMAFRSCGKSTLVGLFAAWLLYRWPDLRILVLAGDQPLAKKMVRNVKRIIEKHPLTQFLKPESADQWASDRFTVTRDKELRDPSMMAKGVSTNITGSRADLILFDDVEVPNTCSSLEKRLDLRQRLVEANFVLVAGGAQIYVGTPHHYHSIYAKEARPEFEEDQPFLHDFKRLEVPILKPCGTPSWPERYSTESIEKLKRATGPNKFESQMMLRPVDIHDSRLDPHLLHFYQGELCYQESGRRPVLTLNDDRMVSASAWWDPAFGVHAQGRDRDASVFALVFSDVKGRRYLHEVRYISCHDDSSEDEAGQQCRQIAMLCRQYYIPSITVEINGLGRFLPSILRRELSAIGYGCAVIEHSARMNKDIRILEAFDVVLAARLLHVHERVKQTPFLREMQEWKPAMSKGHDDGLDAVAGALMSEPVRIERKNATASPLGWQGADKQSHSLHTNFNPYE